MASPESPVSPYVGSSAAMQLRAMQQQQTATQELVRQYYRAIDAHDVDGMLLCVAPDVLVTFQEVSRNWQGADVAQTKFANWFASCPYVKVWRSYLACLAVCASLSLLICLCHRNRAEKKHSAVSVSVSSECSVLHLPVSHLSMVSRENQRMSMRNLGL